MTFSYDVFAIQDHAMCDGEEDFSMLVDCLHHVESSVIDGDALRKQIKIFLKCYEMGNTGTCYATIIEYVNSCDW